MEIEPFLEQFLISFTRQRQFNSGKQNCSASAQDTHKHTEKISGYYDFWG
jgi:hypothetical protein